MSYGNQLDRCNGPVIRTAFYLELNADLTKIRDALTAQLQRQLPGAKLTIDDWGGIRFLADPRLPDYVVVPLPGGQLALLDSSFTNHQSSF